MEIYENVWGKKFWVFCPESYVFTYVIYVLYTLQLNFPLYSVHCMYIVHCILYTVQYILYTIHCIYIIIVSYVPYCF